jgi:hypothetical protein
VFTLAALIIVAVIIIMAAIATKVKLLAQAHSPVVDFGDFTCTISSTSVNNPAL